MAQQTSHSVARFHALFDEAWKPICRTILCARPTSGIGDTRAMAATYPSPRSRSATTSNAATLAHLRRIDRASLSTQDQLSYDLFAWEYKSNLGAYPFKPFLV